MNPDGRGRGHQQGAARTSPATLAATANARKPADSARQCAGSADAPRTAMFLKMSAQGAFQYPSGSPTSNERPEEEREGERRRDAAHLPMAVPAACPTTSIDLGDVS